MHLLDGPLVFGGECVVQKLCDYRGLAHFGCAHDDNLVTCVRRTDGIVDGIVSAHSAKREKRAQGLGLRGSGLRSSRINFN